MDVAYEFTPLVAGKLIVYAFGALVHFFLMVLILGNRRHQRLEWLLFALIAALFMWNSGNLLALNVELYYGYGPAILSGFARLLTFFGLLATLPLLVHVQMEYVARVINWRVGMKVVVAGFYLPLAVALWTSTRLLKRLELDPTVALGPAVRWIALWAVAALLAGALINGAWLSRLGPLPAHLRQFHFGMTTIQAILAIGFAWAYFLQPLGTTGLGGYFVVLLLLLANLPGVMVGHAIFRHNFLDLRVQRNLAYSLAVFLGFLIYLNFMRRLSGWLEARGILPPAVTEAVMIFILVLFLEPVKKLINRALHTAFVVEFEKVQKLASEIQEHAKQTGDLDSLRQFVEERVAAELGLEQVRLDLKARDVIPVQPSAGEKIHRLPILRGREPVGVLEVVSRTADPSGDLLASLRLLCEQLPAALELCQLIADKVKLERQLAEKAKMAFLGEMAARIAHNVKNPLSSMKTLVQLLEEDTTLSEHARQDCRMVVSEIDRLNRSISQVLRYAKPARDTDRPADLSAVVNRVLALARPDAERRQVKIQAESQEACAVEGGEEAANDIVSNLVVNAMEASGPGDTVRVCVRRDPTSKLIELSVEDQGRGIPPDVRAKIFQPFFTTRPGGTGLGLAIVSRRLEEIGGSIECASPLNGGEISAPPGSGARGSRFLVRFRVAA